MHEPTATVAHVIQGAGAGSVCNDPDGTVATHTLRVAIALKTGMGFFGIVASFRLSQLVQCGRAHSCVVR
jgi:hypothetical protein